MKKNITEITCMEIEELININKRKISSLKDFMKTGSDDLSILKSEAVKWVERFERRNKDLEELLKNQRSEIAKEMHDKYSRVGEYIDSKKV